uniref:Uncharacterized protein n=1 Tax=Oryza glumipatula TaxID=40148 RepID=A0A0E0BL08_9ORYZ
MAAEGGSASSAAAGRKVPLPKGYIDAIMALRVEERYPTAEELERLSPDERLAAAFRRESDDKFNKFHAEVRREVEETGVYMVDESYFARQAELQALIKEEWAKIDFSRVHVGDWDEEAGCYK